jgi:hypothetical protein
MKRTNLVFAALLVGAGGLGGCIVPVGDAAPADDDVVGVSSALVIDDSNLGMTTPADLAAKRQQLINFIWGTAGFPPTTRMPSSRQPSVANPVTSAAFTNLARVDRLIISMPQGMQNETFHFVPQVANGRLVIVHQGHSASLNDGGVGATIAALVAEGYGVLGALMPCWNSLGQGPGTGCPITDVNFPGGAHNAMFAQIVPPAGQGNTVKYLLEHLAVSLNYLQSNGAADNFPIYTEFDMAGLSGGGWATVAYAAVDTRIRYSFPSSGTTPMYLKRCSPVNGGTCLDAGGGAGNDGDREQMNPPLYQVAGFLDLYALGAGGTGRRQVQIQIRHDGCCFDEDHFTTQPDGRPRTDHGAANGMTWNAAVRAYEKKLQAFFTASIDRGWYRFEIDETVPGTHQISPTTKVQTLLGELDGDRRPLGAASTSDVYVKGLSGTLFHTPPAWVNTGFPLVGAPSVLEPNTTTTHVFLRDPSSGLIHLTGTNGTSWQSETWPGVIASDPVAAITGNRLDVVAMGTDMRLYLWTKTGTGPIALSLVDANTEIVGPPALVASGTSRLDVFVRRVDGGIWHFLRNSFGWLPVEAVPGTFRGFPAAVATTVDGHLRMYARGPDDQLYEDSKPLAGGAWFTARLPDFAGAVGSLMAGSPTAALNPASQEVFVVVRAPGGSIDKYELAGSWGRSIVGAPPNSSGLTYAPVAVPGGAYTRSVEGNVWFTSFGGAWTSKAGQIY